MALKPERQTRMRSFDYTTPFETERGGMLSLVTMSGMQYAVYDPNPTSSSIALGIQEYDFEEVNLVRAIPPWRSRNAYPAFSICPIIREGIVITNFVHPGVGVIAPGSLAYLAPSGLITPSTEFGGVRVGRFLSALNQSDLGIVGVSSVRAAGNEAILDPQPAMVSTAGWCKLFIQVL